MSIHDLKFLKEKKEIRFLKLDELGYIDIESVKNLISFFSFKNL